MATRTPHTITEQVYWVTYTCIGFLSLIERTNTYEYILSQFAKLTKEEAADKLMKMTERDIRGDMIGLINKLQNEAKETAEDNAAVIITEAMERMARAGSAAPERTPHDCAMESMRHSVLAAEPRGVPSSK